MLDRILSSFTAFRGLRSFILPGIILPGIVLLGAGPAVAQAPFWAPASGPYGGTVVRVLVTPPGGDLLAGTASGVVRSRDGGSTWQAEPGSPTGDVRALAVGPDGTAFAGVYGDGVFRRGPADAAWTATGIRGVLTTALLVDRVGSLFVGTVGGLIRSDDEGETMVVLSFFENVGVNVLVEADPYVIAGTPEGLYRSSDGGTSWEVANVGLRDLNVTALARDGRGNVFAGTSAATGGGTVYRSRNDGSLWTALALPSDPAEVRALAVGPGGILYAGGFRLAFHSSDEGGSWTQSVVAPVSVRGFAFAGTHVLAATAGAGVYRATAGAASWAPANDGLPSTVYDVRVDAGGGVYAGTAGGVFRSTDRGASWSLLGQGPATPDARSLAFDAQGRLLAATSRGLYRLDLPAGVQTWKALGPPGDPALRTLVLGPDGALYAGYYAGIYRLSRSGTWEQYPVYGPDASPRDVIALAVDDAGTLYAGSYWDAFRAPTGPQAWAPMALIPHGDEGVQTFLPAPGGSVYAGTRYSGVRVSTDHGLTWAPRVDGLTGLEDMRVLALDAQGRLYAGTFGSGVFRYDDGAGRWVAASDGLRHLRVVALAFDGSGNAYAATSGGGVYRHLAAGSVGRDDATVPPARLVLHPVYPNPAGAAATLSFDLPEPAPVRVEVFDVLGRRVLAVPEQVVVAGPGRTLVLDTSALAPGLYLYRLTAGSWQAVGRMTKT